MKNPLDNPIETRYGWHMPTTKPQTPAELIHWAGTMMHGTGISTRSMHRASARVHVISQECGEYKIWCGGSPALVENTVKPRYCPECVSLARDMRDDLWEDED